MPAEPNLEVFIPGNVSDARVIQHLDWNEGKGIILWTEADTVGTTYEKEWEVIRYAAKSVSSRKYQ
jgi:hypothetical protein